MERLAVAQLIDERPLGGWLYGMVAICALVLAFDGYDTQAIGYVAPALITVTSLRRMQRHRSV